MVKRLNQKYPQTRQEYLAENALLMGAGQVGRSHGQKIGSETPADPTGVPGW
jgi:hypothetical protein